MEMLKENNDDKEKDIKDLKEDKKTQLLTLINNNLIGNTN